jgi:uncharacterized membrane protein
MMSVVQHQPTGAAFDLVLLLHTAAAAVGLVSTVTAAATGSRLRRELRATAPLPEAVRRYFSPGVNWVGRVVYAVPVLGVALVAMSNGAYSFGDAWILAGMVLFAGVVLLCELVAWPAERRLKVALVAPDAGADTPTPALGRDATALRHDATALTRAAGTAAALLVVAVVVMVAQP